MTQITTERSEIERWAEQHDIVPVEEGGHLELVPEHQLVGNQERIDWETFHRQIDEGNQVVMFHEESSGQHRFEVSDQTTALERVDLEEGYDHDQIEQRLLEGETITGTVTETTVVRETIVEEATIESDIVDRNVVDRQVTDLDLLERTCRSCRIDTEVENIEYEEWGDIDRFLIDDKDVTTGTQQQYDEYPYGVTVQIDERWSVTIEELEEYIVETRITDVDVTETDTVDSQSIESHIDLDAVHEQLLKSIDLRGNETADDIVDTEDYKIDSEFTEDDRLTTTLRARQFIEKEVSEQWQLATDVIAGELSARETHRESVIESGLAEREGTTTTTVDGTTHTEGGVAPSDDEVGKPVVASGDTIGMITDVEEGIAYMDPHPGLTERIMGRLGWSDKDEEDYPLTPDQIANITDDEVRLADDYEE